MTRPLIVLLIATTLFQGALIARLAPSLDGQRVFVLNDDAMISMRYADNWARGDGPVWNHGERVQGFTNPGWTALLALVHLAGLPRRWNSLAVQLIGLFIHLSLIGLTCLAARRRLGVGATLLAAALVAASTPIVFWALCGAESTLECLLITAVLLPWLMEETDRPGGWLAVLGPLVAALAFVVRPDALLFYAGTLGAAFRWRPELTRRRAWQVSVIAGGLVIAALVAAQRAYYGDFLPNTFALKASADSRSIWRGLRYLGLFALWNPALVLGTVAWHRGVGRRRRAALGLLALWAAFIVWVGGDFYLNARFFVPILPALALATAEHLDARWRSPRDDTWRARLAATPGAPLLLVQLAVVPWKLFQDTGGIRAWSASELAVVARLGAARLPPSTIVGVTCAGSVPYFFPELRFHDLLGKSDRFLARSPARWGAPGHNKWDFDYSLDRVAPDLLVGPDYETPGLADTEMRRWLDERRDFGFYPELWLDRRFQERYWPNRRPAPVDGEMGFMSHVLYARSGSPAVTALARSSP